MNKNIQKIRNLKSLKDLRILKANIIRLNREDLLIEIYAKQTELNISQAKFENRRPNINFLEIGLKIGQTIIHKETRETATIASEHTIIHRDIENKITPICELLSKRHTGSVSREWETEDGSCLHDLYNKTYKLGE